MSIDAGDYVCNQTLYLSLAQTALPAGFIHVPHPRARKPLRDRAATQKPKLTQMVDAIARAVVLICRQTRAQA
jgi:pyrrolidone-carboxylate peptidase